MHTHVDEFFPCYTSIPETDTRCNKEKPRLSEAMLETETTVNTRTTDTKQRNHASHESTIATCTNIGASLSDSSLSKKNVATESLVSTLDNVTFSFKRFEHRVHEHFLCWRQVTPSSQECTVALQFTVGRTTAPTKPFSCSQFNSATSCEKTCLGTSILIFSVA